MTEQRPYDNAELLEGLKAGSEAAFTAIYELYWQRVYAVGFYFSGSKQEAEETVQQVFMSLWERRESLEITTSLEGFLATAAKYSVLRERAKQERREKILKDAPLAFEAEPGTPEEQLQGRMLEEALHNAVEKLPERTRIIYTYSRRDELTNAEIAKSLDISIKTVESHMTKALRTVRGTLRELRFLLFFF